MSKNKRFRFSVAIIAATALSMTLTAKASGASPADDAGKSRSPQIHGTVMDHFAAAYEASRTQWYSLYNMLCPRIENPNAGKIAPPPHVRERSIDEAVGQQAMDNLYYVGEKDIWESSPSAWAINTSKGIILLDTLNADSGPIVIERSLRQVGLNPEDIKFILVTHAHPDHFGGARYLQEKYGARVAMSTEDWDYMYAHNPAGQLPKRDVEIKDGDTYTLGGETLHFYVTPGHTPGTVSTIIPVTDNGVPHVAAMWGGTGFGFGGATGKAERNWFQTYHDQAERFRSVAEHAGADVLLANHSILDNTDANFAALRNRRPGDPNPWVVGQKSVQGYITTAAECAAAGYVAMR